jgi:hypothetical protein
MMSMVSINEWLLLMAGGIIIIGVGVFMGIVGLFKRK